VVAALSVIPCDPVDVIAAAEPVAVTPVTAAVRGVLPLGLRWQTESAAGRKRLGQEAPAGGALPEAREEPVGPDDLVPRHVLYGQERPDAASQVWPCQRVAGRP
jgi:hypothetical protein